MANAKRVMMKGTLPFSIGESPKVNRWLGYLNQPTIGLHILYSKHETHYEPNEFGGRTAMYAFQISGVEAVWQSMLVDLVKDFKSAGATFEVAKARDLDNNEPFEDLLVTYAI